MNTYFVKNGLCEVLATLKFNFLHLISYGSAVSLSNLKIILKHRVTTIKIV